MPAWECVDSMPLPATTFTIAQAAKAKGYATTHIGKWHRKAQNRTARLASAPPPPAHLQARCSG